jgi:integrase
VKTRYEGVFKSSSGKYEIVYRDSDRKLRSQVVSGSAKDAAAARAEIMARIGKGETVRASRQTFGELAEIWFEAKANRLRPKTRQQYRDALDLVLLPRFGNKPVAAVNVDAIARLIRDLEREGLRAVDRTRPTRGLSYSSVVNYMKPARGILALAVRRGLMPANPFHILTPDERPHRQVESPKYEWSPEAVKALIDASMRLAARRIAHFDYSTLLCVTATLGLRRGEVLGLRWEDFDKDEGVLHVRRQWLDTGQYGPTKTPASVRRIALPDDLRDELIAHRLRSRHSQEADPIFASAAGTPLLHRNIVRRGFEAARHEAKLPEHLTFHDLRHAAASRLIAAGLSAVTVASVLGHDNPGTTLKVYADLFDRARTDEEVREALSSSRS